MKITLLGNDKSSASGLLLHANNIRKTHTIELSSMSTFWRIVFEYISSQSQHQQQNEEVEKNIPLFQSKWSTIFKKKAATAETENKL